MKTEALQGLVERFYIEAAIVSAFLPVHLRPIFFHRVFYSAN